MNDKMNVERSRKADAPKRREATFPSEKELFKSLADSAFEFLETAIEGVEASPKFSTIHFAIAIELFLKAKLMREHWSLLLDRPDVADKSAFFKGETKTITPDQAINRLRKIANVQVPDKSEKIFLNIAKHRNKMVHFAHAGEMDEEGRNSIVSEQLEGWVELRALLEDWRDFEEYQEKTKNIDQKMEGHLVYLEKKFATVKGALEAESAEGKRIISCPRCKYQSVRIDNQIGSIFEAVCSVCTFRGYEIKLQCKSCDEDIRSLSYEGRPEYCPHCLINIDEDDIGEQLNTGDVISYDNYTDHIPTNCPYCTTMGAVWEHKSLYICSECFAVDDNVGLCEHCYEKQLGGVHINSALIGCDFCEGSHVLFRD